MMMNYEQVNTAYVDAETYPWMPLRPYSEVIFFKILKADPISGTFVTLLKSPGDAVLPMHHHSGTVIVYTIKGRWRYLEHNWTAEEGSLVYETAASRHTPVGACDGEIITLNIQTGDSLYLDDKGQVIAIENWKSAVERYLLYCKTEGITAVDVTSFAE